MQRLNFYKLRAKVIVEDLSETLAVLAVWDGAGANGPGLCYADPRLAALGLRCMISTHLGDKAALELGASLVDAADYEAHRIALGVPRGGSDFIYNDAFPHEADMDQLGGVDFEKGCFVGQEVVSRMEHRGTARTRVVPVAFDGPPPEAGVAVTAGATTLGMMGSGSGAHRPRARDAAPRPRRRCDGKRDADDRRRHRDPAGEARLGAVSMAGRSEGRRMTASLKHADGLVRCPWPKDDPLYVAYHDGEWGVPEYDDRALYEKLILDGFQAGLSWITILRKRDNFRRAFDDFAPEKIARYTPKKVERLMQDAGIVRNRMKIEGTVRSAQAWLDIMENGPGFSKLLWDFCDGKPKVNNFRTIAQVPAETPVSRAISKELAARGFKFCGPTIVYAFMQAVGMVNDHLVTCHRHAACGKLAKKPTKQPAKNPTK